MSFNLPQRGRFQLLTIPMGRFYDWTLPSNPYNGEFRSKLLSLQGINRSQSHFRGKDGKYREGGPWWMMRILEHSGPSGVVTVKRADRKLYSGRFVLSHHWGPSPVPSWWGFSNTHMMDDYWNVIKPEAVAAYNKAKPTRPSMNLANALYELKDVPEMLKQANQHIIQRVRRAWAKKSQNRNMSHTSEWYLALQFGWLPLLGDIRDLCKTQREGQGRLAQLIRDEGKPVKRRRTMPNPFGEVPWNGINHWTWSDDRPNSTYMSPTMVTQAYLGPGRTATEFESWVETQTWFEGQFRYLLPPGPRDVLWKARMWGKILGLDVLSSPSMVYKAVPWSWLVDWFTNVGDMIEVNESGIADNLICDYGYVMHRSAWVHRTSADQYVQTGSTSNPKSTRVNAVLTTRHEHKMRWPATTFGFGVSSQDLNLKQVSILGALGLSRL
jgi:hypothetical protein